MYLVRICFLIGNNVFWFIWKVNLLKDKITRKYICNREQLAWYCVILKSTNIIFLTYWLQVVHGTRSKELGEKDQMKQDDLSSSGGESDHDRPKFSINEMLCNLDNDCINQCSKNCERIYCYKHRCLCELSLDIVIPCQKPPTFMNNLKNLHVWSLLFFFFHKWRVVSDLFVCLFIF